MSISDHYKDAQTSLGKAICSVQELYLLEGITEDERKFLDYVVSDLQQSQSHLVKSFKIMEAINDEAD